MLSTKIKILDSKLRIFFIYLFVYYLLISKFAKN